MVPEGLVAAMALDLEEVKARHAAATPGPYLWVVNTDTKHVELTGGE